MKLRFRFIPILGNLAGCSLTIGFGGSFFVSPGLYVCWLVLGVLAAYMAESLNLERERELRQVSQANEERKKLIADYLSGEVA